MKFHLKPYEHQKKEIDLAMSEDHRALLWDMGTGKTGGLINVLRVKFALEGRGLKVLIFAPSVTLLNWKHEFGIHSRIPAHKIVLLDQSGARRVAKAEQAVGPGYDQTAIIIVNYEAILNKKFFDVLSKWSPEMMVLDESHYIKNKDSKRTKAIMNLSLQQSVKYRYILTGTPVLNNLMEIFSQFKFLDRGETFGTNFFVFRAKYFQDLNAAWASKGNHFPNFVPRKDAVEEINKLIYSKSSRVMKDECLDLPPLIEQTLYVEMSPEQKKAYKQMKNEFITFVKTKKEESKAVVAQLAITKLMKLQQILSGFVVDEEGEVHDFQKVPKLDETKRLLQELTPNHKVILWCCFQHNYKQLSRLCRELKIEHVFLTGEQNTHEKQKSMRDFADVPSVRVVIANRRAGGIGVNLIAASYSIVFSRNFSLGEEEQSKARNYRGGSEIHDKIVKIDLCTCKTLDQEILFALKQKQTLSESVLSTQFQKRI